MTVRELCKIIKISCWLALPGQIDLKRQPASVNEVFKITSNTSHRSRAFPNCSSS